MPNNESFLETMQSAYQTSGPHVIIGAATLADQVYSQAPINIVLKSLNRHGLVAGATGTGKTKTIQMLTEQFSDAGIATLVMDIKGDLSGLAASGSENDHITERQQKIGLDYTPKAYPVELLSLSEEAGVRLRATVSEFGPVLFARMLELNDVQASLVAILFQFAGEEKIPLVHLNDFKELLQYAQGDGKTKLETEYGSISNTSLGTILRRVIELESQGAQQFFGEPSFDVHDLVRTDDTSQGIISILRLIDLQDRPKLFSCFMLSLLTEVYKVFPEAGDLDKPNLIIIIDEAHLLFKEASDALLDKLETIVKLIRSKAVGIIFCTQTPRDIPDAILSQLGLKIQHALRAFTAKDRKAIKLIAENFPVSDFYQTDNRLTSLGIGEALVTTLDASGKPTPLVDVLLRAPQSRMGVLTAEEISQLLSQSKLIPKYKQAIVGETAKDLLKERMENQTPEAKELESKEIEAAKKPSIITELSKNTAVRQVMRTVARELTRGLLGALGIKQTRRSRGKWR